MARVPTDTSSLRGMRQGSRIVARPVDTYTSVSNQVSRNSKGMQIANALAQVEPTLTSYFDRTAETNKKDAKAEGLQSYLEASAKERKAYASKIKSGEIDEIESPFFIEGLSRGILRDKAREFGNDLMRDWNSNKNGIKDVSNFVATRQDEFIKKNALELFDAEVFNAEFGTRAEAFSNMVNQRAYEHGIKRARQAQLTNLGKDMVAARNDNFNTETGQLDAVAYTKASNEVIQDYINQGLDPSAAISNSLSHLEAAGLEDLENRDVYISAMQGIKTRVGTYGETGKGALSVARLSDQLDSKYEAQEDKIYQQDIKDQRRELDVLQENAYTQLVNEGPDYFETEDGKNLLSAILVNPQGGQAVVNNIRSEIEFRETIVSDPETLAEFQSQALGGRDITSEVLTSRELSPQDKVNLLKASQQGQRLGNITNSLGTNHVAGFVSNATRSDGANPLAFMEGTTAYTKLKSEAQIIANNIVLAAASKYDLKDPEEQAEANNYIIEQLSKQEPLIEAKRAEIKGASADTGAGKPPGDVVEIEETGLSPDVKKTLLILPQSFTQTASKLAVEANRPTFVIPEPDLKGTNTNPLDGIDSLEDLEGLINEYNQISIDPTRDWGQSRAFVMAARLGVSVEEVLGQVTSKIVANAPVPEVDEVVAPSGYSNYDPKDFIDAANSVNTSATGSNHLGTYGAVASQTAESMADPSVQRTDVADDVLQARESQNTQDRIRADIFMGQARALFPDLVPEDLPQGLMSFLVQPEIARLLRVLEYDLENQGPNFGKEIERLILNYEGGQE